MGRRREEPKAAGVHSEGFHSSGGPELDVIQKLSKTMAIPLCKIYFSISVSLSITALCRNTAAGNPKEEFKKKKEKKKEAFSVRYPEAAVESVSHNVTLKLLF